MLRGPSDILKFEYMTQLLLDSNYLPLILKTFIYQEVDKAISTKHDREEQRYASLFNPYMLVDGFLHARTVSSHFVGFTPITPPTSLLASLLHLNLLKVKMRLFLHLSFAKAIRKWRSQIIRK